MRALILLIVFCWSVSLNAQTTHRIFNWTRNGLFANWNTHFSDYNGVNKILSDSGFSTFSNPNWGFGFGFSGRSEKVVVQLDFTYLTQCNVNNNLFCSHIDFASYGLQVGYLVDKKNKLDLYPYLGMNRNRTDILLSDVDLQPMNATQFLNTVSNIARMTRVNFSLNAGVGFDYFIPVSKKNTAELMLGIRTGYYLTLNEGTWYMHVDENPLTNVPKTNAGGAYLKTTLGFSF